MSDPWTRPQSRLHERLRALGAVKVPFALGGMLIAGALFAILWHRQAHEVHFSTCPGRLKVESDLSAIYDTAQMVHAFSGAYPGSIDAMVVSVDEEGEEAIGLEQHPKDPWGNDYLYEIRKGEPHVTCLGRDGLPGGGCDDADQFYPEEESP